jgi:hypothetical protein
MAKQRSDGAKASRGGRLESRTAGGSACRNHTDEAAEKCVAGILRICRGGGVAAQNEAIRGAGGKQAVQYKARIPHGEDDFTRAGIGRRASLNLGNVTRPKRWQHAFAANFGVNGQGRVGVEIGAAAHDIRDQSRAYDVPIRV